MFETRKLLNVMIGAVALVGVSLGSEVAHADDFYVNTTGGLAAVWASGDNNRNNTNDLSIVGDVFTLGGPEVLRQVRWEGLYISNPTTGAAAQDDYTIGIYDFSGSTPDNAPLALFNVGHVQREIDRVEFGLDIYAYTASVPDVPLAAGTYLLAISNDLVTAGDPDKSWEWAASSDVDGTYAWNRPLYPAGGWGDKGNFTTDDFYFTLSDVPEPTSMILLLSGASMVGFFRRRR